MDSDILTRVILANNTNSVKQKRWDFHLFTLIQTQTEMVTIKDL